MYAHHAKAGLLNELDAHGQVGDGWLLVLIEVNEV